MLLIDQLITHVESDILALQATLDTCNDQWIYVMEQADQEVISQDQFSILDKSFGERVGAYVESLEIKRELLFYLREELNDFEIYGDLTIE